MKKKLILYTILLVSLFVSMAVNAQSQWETSSKEEALQVLKKINTRTNSARTLEVELKHTITDMFDSKVVLQSSGYFMRKDSSFLKSKVFGVETIQNERYKVVIDSQSNSVVISRPAPMTPVTDISTFEMYFKEYPVQKVVKGRNSEGKSTYIIDFAGDDFPISRISFSFSDDNLLTEYTIDLNQSSNEKHPEAKTRTSIRFSNYKINKSVGEKDFSTNHIIRVKQDRILLTEGYSGYELINTYR